MSKSLKCLNRFIQIDIPLIILKPFNYLFKYTLKLFLKMQFFDNPSNSCYFVISASFTFPQL